MRRQLRDLKPVAHNKSVEEPIRVSKAKDSPLWSRRDPAALINASNHTSKLSSTQLALLTRSARNHTYHADAVLLQLQQRYGNHYVQSVLALSEQPSVRLTDAPDVQALFLSFALKMGAKKATKEMLKRFIKKHILEKLKKVASKKVAKQLAKEADEVISILEDPWWVTTIGFIPIAGDIFDLVNVPRKIRGAIRQANRLELRVKRIIRSQKHWATGVKFSKRGFPIFDKVAKADLKIAAAVASIKDRGKHRIAATGALHKQIIKGTIDWRQFTKSQLEAIREGRGKIPGYTWHHHQQKRRMQLVPEEIHAATGHAGGFLTWFK